MPSEARGRQLVETQRGGFERDFISLHPTWRCFRATTQRKRSCCGGTGQTTAADDNPQTLALI